MSANVFTNNSMGEGMGVNVLEMDINISTDFKGRVYYISQTAWLLKQARVCIRLSF